jgi:hypothetical protein
MGGLAQATRLLRAQQEAAHAAGDTRLEAAAGYRFAVGRQEQFEDMTSYPVITGRYASGGFGGSAVILEDEQPSQEATFYGDRLEVVQSRIVVVDDQTGQCRVVDLMQDQVMHELLPEPGPATA